MAIVRLGTGDVMFVANGEPKASVRAVRLDPPYAVHTVSTDPTIAHCVALMPGSGGGANEVNVLIGAYGIALVRFSAKPDAGQAHTFQVSVEAGSNDAPSEGTRFADGAAATARFNYVAALCVKANGEGVYIADCDNHRIRLLTREKGFVATVAGTGEEKNGADGPALTTALDSPCALAWDVLTPEPETALYFGCYQQIRRLNLITGAITTVCSGLRMNVFGLVAAPCGLLLFACGAHAIYAVDPRAGPNAQPVALAGLEGVTGSSDGRARTTARLGDNIRLALDAARTCVWFTEKANHT